MRAPDSVMSRPGIYRVWMAPFAAKKFAPILANNQLSAVKRVLDVGCGPGTNAHYFAGSDYLGVDRNERYIREAQRVHKGRFLVADAAKLSVPRGERFDFVLINSLLHHLDTATVLALLSYLSTLLTEDGYLHILELTLPEHASLARFLTRVDRGEFARSLDEWRKIFGNAFEQIIFAPYDLVICGATLWKMVYFKGTAKKI
jgi:SAM-dependent methyltransferase